MADPIVVEENGRNGSGPTVAHPTGTSLTSDELALRGKARLAIERGRVPRSRPDGTWAGPGTGSECAICGVPVAREEVEFEIEYARDGGEPAFDRYHIHTRCFAAWELERQGTQSP
jgi:hypothetical protein